MSLAKLEPPGGDGEAALPGLGGERLVNANKLIRLWEGHGSP